MIAALGIGYLPEDFGAFGVPLSQRSRRTEECVEILREAWTGRPFSYESKYHKINNIRVTPTPYKEYGPPIWMAGWAPSGLERAGRMGDGWLADPMQSLDVISGYASQYRAEAKKYGRKPYVVLMRDCIVGDTWNQCVIKSESTMVMHKFYFKNGAYNIDKHLNNIKNENDLTFEILANERFICGSTEQCIDQLKMWVEVILPDYLMLRMRQPGGPPQAEALKDIRRFAEKIMPNI